MSDVKSLGLNGEYVCLQTTENQKVYIRKEAVAAVEEVPSTTRSEGHFRLYVSGYRFSVKEIPESWGMMQSPSADSE